MHAKPGAAKHRGDEVGCGALHRLVGPPDLGRHDHVARLELGRQGAGEPSHRNDVPRRVADAPGGPARSPPPDTRSDRLGGRRAPAKGAGLEPQRGGEDEPFSPWFETRRACSGRASSLVSRAIVIPDSLAHVAASASAGAP